jgi:hypothetical protein
VSSCDFIGVKLNEQNTQSRQIKADMYWVQYIHSKYPEFYTVIFNFENPEKHELWGLLIVHKLCLLNADEVKPYIIKKM